MAHHTAARRPFSPARPSSAGHAGRRAGIHTGGIGGGNRGNGHGNERTRPRLMDSRSEAGMTEEGSGHAKNANGTAPPFVPSTRPFYAVMPAAEPASIREA